MAAPIRTRDRLTRSTWRSARNRAIVGWRPPRCRDEWAIVREPVTARRHHRRRRGRRLGIHASVDYVLHFPLVPIASAILAAPPHPAIGPSGRYRRRPMTLRSETTEPTQPTVVYVGAHDRSGSTLLDRVLGELPGCVSLEGATDLESAASARISSSGCGTPFRGCAYWQTILHRAFGVSPRSGSGTPTLGRRGRSDASASQASSRERTVLRGRGFRGNTLTSSVPCTGRSSR